MGGRAGAEAEGEGGRGGEGGGGEAIMKRAVTATATEMSTKESWRILMARG